MKRLIKAVTLVLALALVLMIPTSAFAASKLSKYTLIYEGKEVALSLSTGYLFRQGSYFMVPVEKICKLAGLEYTVNKLKNGMTIKTPEDGQVSIRLNSKAVEVDGVKKNLRTKTLRQDGKKLTADVRLLSELGLTFKHYKASKETRAMGYGSGVLVVAKAGGDVTLPDLTPSIKLPAEAAEAAQTAKQIVTIECNTKSGNRLTFYQKSGGKWNEEFSTKAYIGKNGTGKTVEGDNKTPIGTFNLTQPFGLLSDPGTKLGKYVKVNKYHYWSGQNGTYYNQLVNTQKIKTYVPSKADEHLIDYKGVYNYGIFIDYNAAGVANKGSAIFLHCKGSKNTTGGCVAVSQTVMRELLKKLKPGAKIVIYG